MLSKYLIGGVEDNMKKAKITGSVAGIREEYS
jgi:hypothetical protein